MAAILILAHGPRLCRGDQPQRLRKQSRQGLSPRTFSFGPAAAGLRDTAAVRKRRIADLMTLWWRCLWWRRLTAAPKKGTLAPKLGAKDFTGQLGAALFGKSKRALLALFYTQPDRSYYLRQITRSLRLGQGAMQRELARLAAAGLLVRTRVGSQLHYQANPASPVFGELKALCLA